MPSIPELLDGHVTLELECLDRLYLNGYIGPLATSGGLVMFMREQLGKPIPSPVILGQVTEKFRESIKSLAEREQIPLYQFDHRERKDDVAIDSASNAACATALCLSAWRRRKRKPSKARRSMDSSSSHATKPSM